MDFSCSICDRSFSSQDALQQHTRDSPAHLPAFPCDACDRSFGSQESFDQHMRDSPAHNPRFGCDACDRSFRSQDSLDQHMRDSPAHARRFECETCDRFFDSESALEQHMRDAPAHAPAAFDCESCDRSFARQESLDQHMRDSPRHRQNVATPLDMFFRSFPLFNYDPSLPPATSYASLGRHMGWRRGQSESREAWQDYQDALRRELRMWYGQEDDLTAWHALCRAVGITPLPDTCARCESAARRTHVNIVDLIEWGRSNREEPVHRFNTVQELRDYTARTRKIFRNNMDGEDGNVVLRHLLRKIFRGNL